MTEAIAELNADPTVVGDHRPDAVAGVDPAAVRHRRDRSGEGHRRHPPAQRRSPAARLRRLPAGHGPRGGRDPASLRHRDRRPARRRHRAVGGRRHAGGVPAGSRERDRHRLPLADARPRSTTSRTPRSSSSRPAGPGLVTGSMLRRGAVVVDVGINVVDGALVGDVDFESARHVASAITPVPGGVGPLTNALLLAHLARAAQAQAAATPEPRATSRRTPASPTAPASRPSTRGAR